VKLVCVEWVDIFASAGWEKEDEIEPPTFWNVGYLVRQDKRVVKIATTKDEKGEYFGITAFPVGCVVSIRYINEKDDAE
jgi:hypothetical protein